MIDPKIHELATVGQRRVLAAVDAAEKAGRKDTHRAAALALGMTAGSVKATVQKARARAAARGYAPEAGLTHAAPEGAAWRGTSTLYQAPTDDPHGRLLIWHKTKPDHEAALEAVEKSIAELAEAARPAAPLPAPEEVAEDLLVVNAFGDPHFGMYADARETGHAHYDTRIASRLHRGAIDLLIARAPAAGRCILALIGDNMHADGRQWLTPKSRHAVDGDGRTWSVYDELVLSLAWMADRALMRHGHVEIVVIPGNHDPILSHALASTMRAHYRAEPRLTVADLKGSKYHFTTHGRCLLGFYHGDGRKAGIKDFGELSHGHPAWSQSRIRHGYTGHIHEERRLSGRGWTAESLPTLAPADSYAAAEGWSPPHAEPASRSAKADVYHIAGRRVSAHFVTAEEIAA
jgi:hypothetical protein